MSQINHTDMSLTNYFLVLSCFSTAHWLNFNIFLFCFLLSGVESISGNSVRLFVCLSLLLIIFLFQTLRLNGHGGHGYGGHGHGGHYFWGRVIC